MIAFVLVCVFIFALYFVSQRKPKNFPPGPWGIPLLGHLPLLGLEPHVKAMQWKSTYGLILGVNFGSFPCVIISDYHLAKEALALESFSDRPLLQFSFDRSGGHGHVEGVGMTSERPWREQRGFTHRGLRQIGGFGTRSMEAIILEQMQELLKRLEPHAEARIPIATYALFNVAVVNVIWGITAGEPFDHDDQKLQQVSRLLIDGFSEVSMLSLVSIFLPWLRIFPDRFTGQADLENHYKPIVAFMKPYVEHWQTHMPGQPRDFIDAYIDEIKNTTDPTSSFHQSRAAYSLPTTLLDLFIAGSETSSTALRWTCLLLARYPAVQERLVHEIEAVLGVGVHCRCPSLADRPAMPYIEAVIHEVLRFRPIAPLGFYHSTAEAVHFHGHDIPKGTMVFANVHEAHFNRELWGDDAEEFRPERWLKSDGGGGKVLEFVKREGFFPFLSGKRVCIGEQFAHDELLLFTAGLMQKFRVDVDPSNPLPTLDPKLGGTTQGPKPHKLLFTPRA